MKPFRTAASTFLLAVAGFLHAIPAPAQTVFPSKPVHWIVPFQPGGSAEIISRVIANRLRVVWGQPVIIDNKPGAGTLIGTEAIAKAAPDGHTFGLVITAHVINPSMRKLPYDTLKDFAGVTQLVNLHLALMAHPSAPYNNISELVAYSKANPGKVPFGTVGAGTSSHLFGELLNQATGSSLVHVAYKGSSPAQADPAGRKHPADGRFARLAIADGQRGQDEGDRAYELEASPGLSIPAGCRNLPRGNRGQLFRHRGSGSHPARDRAETQPRSRRGARRSGSA
jgi:tripartite-type tricarboxylate transporter receptor subunit TctC